MRRRTILRAMGAGLVTGGLTSAWTPTGSAQGRRECAPPTRTNIEGPYYRRSAPETATLDRAGRLVVSGHVLDARCGPARNAMIEVWHADEAGEYDMHGYRHRGVVRCDARGHYSYRTVRPGHYLNGRSYRPAHIHVKVHAEGRPVLTTQLYFAGDPYNERDPWFQEALVLRESPTRSAGPSQLRRARFDFIV